ncbi:unnamed protein product [Aphanomyces euteiches]|uniref:beta-glucosidase n=2 Tax=Aphanomyces euteiches TaxID=100861 RepID=A0A6G0WRJ2_9STRA|nr:hypothetical protein Ae201684_012431 [Aphanomyces euteiches]KAH9090453.1 hypothetical protein Ae201684P_014255 [Aphanomyces euteiches]KAH9142772.1 hypothetical protein AeRB84_013180 [Aphanomyces euteiches]
MTPFVRFGSILALLWQALGATDPAVSVDHNAQAWALVRAMTPEQLVGHMNQLDVMTVRSDPLWNERQVESNARRFVGSYVNTPSDQASADASKRVWNVTQWRKGLESLQALQFNMTKTPILYGLDSIHGAQYVSYAVLFPQSINAGATFDPDAIYSYGSFVARDTKAAGIPWVFYPVLDVLRHKHWSRLYESFGEDPFQVAEMAQAVVRGIQSRQVAACFKHFIGYSATNSGNDRDYAELSDYELLNHFAPPFKATIDAGIMTGMGSFIGINGIPLAANERLHRGLLRHDLAFNGTFVTDWGELYFMHNDVPGYSKAQAVQEALEKSEYDLVMVPADLSFADAAKGLLDDGKVSLERIQQSVQRILKLKLDLKLYDDAVPGADLAETVGDRESELAALKIAQESIVLLKNQAKTLPLTRTASVFMTGPAMDDIGLLCGGWTLQWQGLSGGTSVFPHGKTILQAFQAAMTQTVASFRGVDVDGRVEGLDTAKSLARQSEFTVVVVGERTFAEVVGNYDSATFPRGLVDYIQALAATGTKLILVLTGGRPRVLQGLADVASAVLWAGLPCEMGGQAIADVLLGVVNPSGKLPLTYPKTEDFDNLATPYYHRHRDICLKSRARCPAEWNFGHGLSYTEFVYSNMLLRALSSTGISISATISNRGSVVGTEVVMLFMIPPPVRASAEAKLLKKFTRVELQPGQAKHVEFTLTTDDVGYYSNEIGHGLEKSTDDGIYTFYLNASTDCAVSQTLCRSFRLGKLVNRRVLLNPTSNKCLAVTNKSALSSNGELAQAWILDEAQDLVQSTQNGWCLAAFSNAKPLEISPCSAGNGDQKWFYDASTSQLRHIKHVGSCFQWSSVEDDGLPRLAPCLKALDAHLVTQEVQLYSPPPLKVGHFVFSHTVVLTGRKTSQRLTLELPTTDAKANQEWTIDADRSRIQLTLTSLCLTASFGQFGGRAGLEPCSNDDAGQQWHYDLGTRQLRQLGLRTDHFVYYCLDRRVKMSPCASLNDPSIHDQQFDFDQR